MPTRKKTYLKKIKGVGVKRGYMVYCTPKFVRLFAGKPPPYRYGKRKKKVKVPPKVKPKRPLKRSGNKHHSIKPAPGLRTASVVKRAPLGVPRKMRQLKPTSANVLVNMAPSRPKKRKKKRKKKKRRDSSDEWVPT